MIKRFSELKQAMDQEVIPDFIYGEFRRAKNTLDNPQSIGNFINLIGVRTGLPAEKIRAVLKLLKTRTTVPYSDALLKIRDMIGA